MELVHTSKPDDDRKVVNINMKKNTIVPPRNMNVGNRKKSVQEI